MRKYDIIFPSSDEYRKIISPQNLDFIGSIFYEPDFLEISSQILNLEFQPAVVVEKDSIIGIANYLIGGKAGAKIAMIPKMFQYFGPVCFADRSNVFDQLVSSVADQMDSCVFSLVPSMTDFSRTGWRSVDRLTFILELNTYENMADACTRNCRKKVNKAMREGVEFRETHSLPYEIYYQTFKRRNKRPFLDEASLVNWVDDLSKQGLAKTFIACFDGKPVAFKTILYYGKFLYYWFSGALPEYLKMGVNNFLTLKAGEYFYGKGVKQADFVGGDIKAIAEFKKSFGSQPLRHIQLEKNFTVKGKIYRGLMKIKAMMNG